MGSKPRLFGTSIPVRGALLSFLKMQRSVRVLSNRLVSYVKAARANFKNLTNIIRQLITMQITASNTLSFVIYNELENFVTRNKV